jgi:hypothetical protein
MMLQHLVSNAEISDDMLVALGSDATCIALGGCGAKCLHFSMLELRLKTLYGENWNRGKNLVNLLCELHMIERKTHCLVLHDLRCKLVSEISEAIDAKVLSGGFRQNPDGVAFRLTKNNRCRRLTQRWLDTKGLRVVKEKGMAVIKADQRRDRHATGQEGVQLACYHNWAAEQMSGRTRVAVAMDGSNVVGDTMTYAAGVLSRPPLPERVMWLPIKV